MALAERNVALNQPEFDEPSQGARQRGNRRAQPARDLRSAVSAPRCEAEHRGGSGDVIEVVAEEAVGFLVEHTEWIEGEIVKGVSRLGERSCELPVPGYTAERGPAGNDFAGGLCPDPASKPTDAERANTENLSGATEQRRRRVERKAMTMFSKHNVFNA
jgi:hypothetical protein